MSSLEYHKEFQKFLESREAEIAPGIFDKWLWIREDSGAWDGPIKDFRDKGHSEHYFKWVKNHGTVVTAGANLGLYVRAYSSRFKRVFAFEPSWMNFYCMSFNNPYENVIKFQAALSDHSGFSKLVTSHKTNVGTHKLDENSGTEFVVLMTIDQLNLEECDLIQLDVERHEYEALIGATETIKKFKPAIIIESVNGKIRDFMNSHGYEEVAKTGHADVVFVHK